MNAEDRKFLWRMARGYSYVATFLLVASFKMVANNYTHL